MIKKIDHIVITTEKIDECLAFYEILGFKIREAGARWELFSGDFKINVHIKGHELEPKAENVQVGSADICFEIDGSIRECMKEMTKHGIKTDILVRHGTRGDMHSIYLRDPDGNLIELCSYDIN